MGFLWEDWTRGWANWGIISVSDFKTLIPSDIILAKSHDESSISLPIAWIAYLDFSANEFVRMS